MSLTKEERIVIRKTLERPATIILIFTCVGVAWTYLMSREVLAEISGRAASAQVRTVISHPLPQLDGSHLTVEVVEVGYAPGGSSPSHSHPCPVIAVVVQGAIRTQVKGEPEAVYHAGQSFYEAPKGVHLISANADKTKPAKLLAYFVCDHETPDTVAVPHESAAVVNRP
jgi:quercetin dioxygenase-like cupin family protein